MALDTVRRRPAFKGAAERITMRRRCWGGTMDADPLTGFGIDVTDSAVLIIIHVLIQCFATSVPPLLNRDVGEIAEWLQAEKPSRPTILCVGQIQPRKDFACRVISKSNNPS